jgi:phosphomannomutase
MLLSEYFLTKHPGATILYNATCGMVVPETIERLGGKAIRTKVGHSFIKGEMRKHGAVFGGESSGHYYFQDNFMADSGLIAGIVALSILSESKQPLSKLVDKYRKYFQIPETNFEVSDKDGIMKNIAGDFADKKQDWLDGLTVWFDGGWCNVRPSNTEPILRLNAEAKNQVQLDEIVAKVTKLIAG